MVSTIVTLVVSLVDRRACCDCLTRNATLSISDSRNRQASPYASTIFLSIIVLDKFYNGVHMGSRYFLLALLAQKKRYVLFVVLE